MANHFQIIIIGGGTGGLMVAAQLHRKNASSSMAIFEPSEEHVYQPAWTLVGAGTYDIKDTIRKTADFIPSSATWIKQKVQELVPEHNQIISADGTVYQYDYLVVATGLVYEIDALEGLGDALKKDNVCSNYLDPEKTWRVLQNFKGGNALFTQPNTPIKCGGAPQKIMYLAEHYFRKHHKRSKTNVIFATPGSVIFGVKEFAKTLMDIVKQRHIVLKTSYAPIRIDSEKQVVYFKYTAPADNQCVTLADDSIKEEALEGNIIAMPYDMLHIAPPQAAPAFIKNSAIAVKEGPSKGWANVDKYTLKSPDFPNVFVVGDVANLPTAKTGAAIRKQAPVVVEQLINAIHRRTEKLSKVYEGYSSCPLVTSYDAMVLAEFKYDNVLDKDPLLSKFIDTTKEQYSMWLLKKYGLPYLYWNYMLKGKM